MELISVIIPVYKVEKYLEQCVESVRQQTYSNIEIILVDDGSPDKCGKICDEYACKDKRIKAIHQNNMGLSVARNTGVEYSKGEYLVFIDSDDYIHPKLLEISYREAKKYNCDLVVYNYKKIKENTDYNEKNMIINEKYNIEIYDNLEGISQLFNDKYGEFNAAWSKLYKRHIFDKVKFPEGKIYEDALLAHEILYNSYKIVYIPLKLYYYRNRKDSIVNSNFSFKNLDFVESCYIAMSFYNNLRVLDINIKYKSQEKYVYYFFKYYYKSKYELINWKSETQKMKKDFLKSLKILFFSPVFSKKEKLSWIIFLLTPKIYDLYFDKRKGDLNDG